MPEAGVKVVDIKAFKRRFKKLLSRMKEAEYLEKKVAAVKNHRGTSCAGEGETGYCCPEEEAYEGASDLLRDDFSTFLDDALAAFRALDKAIEEFDEQIAANDLSVEHIEPSMVDFIDQQIEDGKVCSVQDIVAIFESGELKGIVTSDDEIDRAALKAFERKQKTGRKRTG